MSVDGQNGRRCDWVTSAKTAYPESGEGMRTLIGMRGCGCCARDDSNTRVKQTRRRREGASSTGYESRRRVAHGSIVVA